MSTLLFANLTYSHIIIVLLVAVLFFGNRLPEIAKMMAQSFRAFRRTMDGMEDDVADVVSGPAPKAALAAPPRITAPSFPASERNGLAPEPPAV